MHWWRRGGKMIVDINAPMTFYELIGIILAILALIIPFVKWIIEKWIKRLKIDFLVSDVITIYFNRGGSYIHLGGVYKADNKNATIKNISASIKRKSDNAILPLTWSTFPSPTVREIGGQYEHSFETAHPFSANADTLTPIFIEFTNPKRDIGEEISAYTQNLYNVENMILNQSGISLIDADGQVRRHQEYLNSKVKLHELCFWRASEYEVNLITKYDNREFIKSYSFELKQEDVEKLQRNIENLLVEPIAIHFNLRLTYYTVRKNLTEK